MATSKSSGPASVAEGLGNVLSAITDTMKAPDATQAAGELMKLQTDVLDLIHGKLKVGGQPGQPPAPSGAAPGGAPPAAGGGGLMGGLAGLQGASPQGPSAAASGGLSSGPGGGSGGMDADSLRQLAAVGADDAS